MATDQVAVESQAVEDQRPGWAPSPSASRGGRGWGFRILIGLAVAAAAGGGYYLFGAGGDRGHTSDHPAAAGHASANHGGGGASASDSPRVEVVKPKRGGMERTTKQPGTVRAFEFAELYAKVSGYVKELKVDRGSRVKMGDPLIELFVPELVAAVEQAKASLARANAGVVMAQARVKSANEVIAAKKADLDKANSDLKARSAAREYRDKQFDRIHELVVRKAVEPKLEDEEADRRAAAHEDEAAAKSGVAAARAHIAEAEALLAQAGADVKGAEAEVAVSQATLDKETALESYTHIKSPYDGVIIFRGEGVHKGAFVRSADEGMASPMLTVAMDSMMRTIVPVPDLDVPFVDLGDPTIVRIDALSGREFQGQVSRIAESEDIKDRTMRVEIDLANEKHILRDGMFGRAEIILEKATKNLTVPSTAVLNRDDQGKGTVEVVRDGKMYRQPVVIGRDTGTTAEIISGLEPDSDVIVQPDVSMADGTPVEIESHPVADAPRASGSAHS